jgi:hypothetical protein
MATNPVHASELNLTIERTSAEIIVHCSGRTRTQFSHKRTTVKLLFSEGKAVVLD